MNALTTDVFSDYLDKWQERHTKEEYNTLKMMEINAEIDLLQLTQLKLMLVVIDGYVSIILKKMVSTSYRNGSGQTGDELKAEVSNCSSRVMLQILISFVDNWRQNR